MPGLRDTAYPRLKTTVTPHDLADVYTPTADERALAAQVTKGAPARAGFLIVLKAYQRLGYATPVAAVPPVVVEHIVRAAGLPTVPTDLAGYDHSGTRIRHLAAIRAYLRVRPFDRAARRAMVRALADAARTKDDLVDLINVAIEELIRQSYELPAFDTLNRAARHVRASTARSFYAQVFHGLAVAARAAIDALFIGASETGRTAWNDLKADPGRPTVAHLQALVLRRDWLAARHLGGTALAALPVGKVRQFAAEAKTLDAGRMQALEPHKRYTLAAALLAVQSAQTLDDLGEMFVRRMLHLQAAAKAALERYRAESAQRTDLLAALTLRSTSQDTALHDAVRFLRSHQYCSGDWLQTTRKERTGTAASQAVPLLDLSWVPDGWWRLVTGLAGRGTFPERVNRRHFEVCVFSQVMWELKSGDLAIEGSASFADYRAQLVGWDVYAAEIAAYGQVAGLAVEGPEFVRQVRSWLEGVAEATDRAFPTNQWVRLEQGEPVIVRPERAAVPPGVPALETLLLERMPPVTILDALGDTAHWLRWTRFFGPISGHDAKLEDPVARYLATVFCYGCNLGPAQTARSLEGLDRRQVIWINQRHVTEERLDQATACVIDAYQRFTLPKCWGAHERVAADGTKWDLYEQNLLSEYHIRYGGYGGIGYYHVAGNYIACFSHFIPCGALEGVYILDPFFEREDEAPPDAVHSDTHGQSAAIFGLAYLLGIQLMPRINGWGGLTLHRAGKERRYEHIDALFTATIDWELIATHLPDMLRVALSIKAGSITPSTILRRLGTYSRKNRLYHAFRELGRAVRTGFLLRYMIDPELRATIHAAMNKGESFNHYTKWVSFGGHGVIAENDRAEQRKVIKYNHLVANCLIFHTVATMTHVLTQAHGEGIAVDAEAVAAISPYITSHLNRFGRYHLDLTRAPWPVDYEAPAFRHASEEAATGMPSPPAPPAPAALP